MHQTRPFYKLVIALGLVGALIIACSKRSAESILDSTFSGLNAEHHCINWQEQQRCYYLVKPSGKPYQSKRMLVALHPAFHDVAALEDLANIVHPVEANNIIAIYPEGITKQWNDGRHAEKAKPFRDGIDDVGFLTRIILAESKRFNIAKKNITVAGMSNGAMMAMRLACESTVIGRMVSVVGNLPEKISHSCHRSNLEQVTLVFGTDDDVVPYRGGKLGSSDTSWGRVISAKATETHIASLLGCNQAYQQYRLDADPSDDTIAHKRDFICPGKKMTSYHVQGMGHTWPSEGNNFQAFITGRGTISKELNGNKLVIDAILSN